MQMQFYDINIYQFGNEYKVVYLKRFETSEPHIHEKDLEPKMIGDRFSCNISRSKSTILGLALCNDWQYFVTFTLDAEKYDRYDLKKFIKDLSQFIRNQRRLHNYDIKYVLIPEQHQDGAWHMHGLFSGIPWDDLEFFNAIEHPIKLVTGGYKYSKAFLNKFGFNSFGKIKSKAAVSRYILKYVGKGLGLQDIEQGAHLYYASQRLNRPKLVKQSISDRIITDIDYKNDFMASKWLSEKEYNSLDEEFSRWRYE